MGARSFEGARRDHGRASDDRVATSNLKLIRSGGQPGAYQRDRLPSWTGAVFELQRWQVRQARVPALPVAGNLDAIQDRRSERTAGRPGMPVEVHEWQRVPGASHVAWQGEPPVQRNGAVLALPREGVLLRAIGTEPRALHGGDEAAGSATGRRPLSRNDPPRRPLARDNRRLDSRRETVRYGVGEGNDDRRGSRFDLGIERRAAKHLAVDLNL